MPPRKRAEPKPAELDETNPVVPDQDAPASASEEPKSGSSEPKPCTGCFPAGWPDGATSVGCGHGTWNRDL